MTSRQYFTVPELEVRIGLSAALLLKFIKAGNLRARDARAPGARQPYCQVRADHLAEFEARLEARAVQPPKQQATTTERRSAPTLEHITVCGRQRNQLADGTIDFFPNSNVTMGMGR